VGKPVITEFLIILTSQSDEWLYSKRGIVALGGPIIARLDVWIGLPRKQLTFHRGVIPHPLWHLYGLFDGDAMVPGRIRPRIDCDE